MAREPDLDKVAKVFVHYRSNHEVSNKILNIGYPVSRLKIATYNVRTLLRDEHVQELEELKETRLVWGVVGIGELRR